MSVRLNSRGRCSVCSGEYVLRADGCVRRHGASFRPECAGSSRAPSPHFPTKETPMTTVTVYGYSDDLIEVDGDIYEEFTLHNEAEGDLLAFSDGTILRVTYGDQGVWRIETVFPGSADLTLVQAPEHDDANYSDRVTLTLPADAVPPLVWVVHGQTHGVAKS